LAASVSERRRDGFHWLGIFDKVGSSEVVKTLHNQTRVSFRIFLMGFRNGSPLNFRNSARFLPAPRLRRAGARVKRQVQSEDFWREDFWEGNANAKYSGVFAV